MQGENFVSMKGYVQWPELKTVGEKNSKLFKGKLAIPLEGDKKQYIKIAAWHEMAEGLGGVPETAFIHIHGHVEERSYDGKCKGCGASEKKYWTEIVVDNFAIIG